MKVCGFYGLKLTEIRRK